ncbi:MAG: hypothetical protein PHU69_10680 [Fermentimonas sp.]|nr:hypothetical protein [Fermentimonas sp.]
MIITYFGTNKIYYTVSEPGWAKDPTLFFTLRAVDIHDLISKAIQSKTQTMLSKSGAKSRHILENADIAAMFGVEVEAMVPDVTNITDKKQKSQGKRTRKKV